MKILIKILKVLGILVLVGAVSIGALIAYENYETEKRAQAELVYKSTESWQWHDKYDRIQISYDEKSKRSALRKVFMRSSTEVFVYKGDDYKLNAIAIFHTKCSPSAKIKTTKKYSDGKPIYLECSGKGDKLFHAVTWNGKDTNFTWRENLDGFKLYVDFTSWDFTKLDQEITLSKAKSPNTQKNKK